MQLMGHAQIQTTLVYVQLTPQDLWEQYARAVANTFGQLHRRSHETKT
jgi:site-specific recombinase XerD